MATLKGPDPAMVIVDELAALDDAVLGRLDAYCEARYIVSNTALLDVLREGWLSWR